MKKKDRTLTIYFEEDDPVYESLLSMNKFLRAEYIRAALREAVNKNMTITASAGGINIVYPDGLSVLSQQVIENDKLEQDIVTQNHDNLILEQVSVNNNSFSETKDPVSAIKDMLDIELEENTDPLAI